MKRAKHRRHCADLETTSGIFCTSTPVSRTEPDLSAASADRGKGVQQQSAKKCRDQGAVNKLGAETRVFRRAVCVRSSFFVAQARSLTGCLKIQSFSL